MDTNKLYGLIDKVIGKKGPLRVPAYWMGRVLKGIVGLIDKKAEEIKLEVDNELKDKLDRAIRLTYKEFHDMCYKRAGIKGQYYHISDYKPTISELQEEFHITSPYEGKLYVEYNGVIIDNSFSRDYVRTVFKGYVSTAEKTYEVDYNLHSGSDALNNKWVIRRFDGFDTIVVRYEDYGGVLNNLTLRNKASIDKDSVESWLFEDTLTKEEYEVYNYGFENNVFSLSLNRVVDSTYYHEVKVVDYTFRTYGYISRMKDCTQNLEVCYDFIGMSWEVGTIRGFIDSKIMGYPLGLLPRVSKSLSYVVSGVEVINSDRVKIYGKYQNYSTKLRITSCDNVVLDSCDNVVLDSCDNVRISNARDCYFIYCHDIENTTQLFSSKFQYLTSTKRIEYVSNSFFYSPRTDTITNVVGIGYSDVIGSHVAIKDGQVYSFYTNRNYTGATPVYPKTKTSLVIDEATGDTLDSMLPFKLEINLSSPISAENFDKLKAAMVANRPIYLIDASGAIVSAVVMPDMLDNNGGLIATLIVPLVSSASTNTITCLMVRLLPDRAPEPLIDLTNPPFMVKAGKGVSIEPDGTLNCTLDTLDTNLFIIVSTLPSEGVEGKIYLIPSTVTGEQNVMVEYIWVNGTWEKLGEFKTDVDLSAYALKSEVPEVVDNLTEGGATKALSAEMGKLLSEMISGGGSNVMIFDEADVNNIYGTTADKVCLIRTVTVKSPMPSMPTYNTTIYTYWLVTEVSRGMSKSITCVSGAAVRVYTGMTGTYTQSTLGGGSTYKPVSYTSADSTNINVEGVKLGQWTGSDGILREGFYSGQYFFCFTNSGIDVYGYIINTVMNTKTYGKLRTINLDNLATDAAEAKRIILDRGLDDEVLWNYMMRPYVIREGEPVPEDLIDSSGWLMYYNVRSIYLIEYQGNIHLPYDIVYDENTNTDSILFLVDGIHYSVIKVANEENNSGYVWSISQVQ